ncbi:hypothetical protein MLD38_038492 [Melastoma candidum]|uniref:Uncharacterized protein n=1 Tax=Melastoma candidum TaxID=119954 RepID=A0ACB9KZ28_9MYRT|nr:hypothetical protein MLD38_038492 [Melastoma candidum]
MVGRVGGPVCVTGGTGFIGSSMVVRLLEDYSVRTTFVVLSGYSKRDTSYLTNLPGETERLEIFYNADLDHPETFRPAIEGCVCVYHVAHPVDVSTNLKDGVDVPMETITQTSLGGMLGILKISVESKTVKRVVCTSAMGTTMFNWKTT